VCFADCWVAIFISCLAAFDFLLSFTAALEMQVLYKAASARAYIWSLLQLMRTARVFFSQTTELKS
jgi:hypothetical protein